MHSRRLQSDTLNANGSARPTHPRSSIDTNYAVLDALNAVFQPAPFFVSAFSETPISPNDSPVSTPRTSPTFRAPRIVTNSFGSIPESLDSFGEVVGDDDDEVYPSSSLPDNENNDDVDDDDDEFDTCECDCETARQWRARHAIAVTITDLFQGLYVESRRSLLVKRAELADAHREIARLLAVAAALTTAAEETHRPSPPSPRTVYQRIRDFIRALMKRFFT